MASSARAGLPVLYHPIIVHGGDTPDEAAKCDMAG